MQSKIFFLWTKRALVESGFSFRSIFQLFCHHAKSDENKIRTFWVGLVWISIIMNISIIQIECEQFYFNSVWNCILSVFCFVFVFLSQTIDLIILYLILSVFRLMLLAIFCLTAFVIYFFLSYVVHPRSQFGMDPISNETENIK